jgi:hypothetical protein
MHGSRSRDDLDIGEPSPPCPAESRPTTAKPEAPYVSASETLIPTIAKVAMRYQNNLSP